VQLLLQISSGGWIWILARSMGCCSPFSTRTHAGCNYSELGLSFFVGLPGRFVELWQEVERPSETGATQVEEMLFGMRLERGLGLGLGLRLGCLCWPGEGCETCRVARRQLTMWKRCRLSCCRCCQSQSEIRKTKDEGWKVLEIQPKGTTIVKRIEELCENSGRFTEGSVNCFNSLEGRAVGRWVLFFSVKCEQCQRRSPKVDWGNTSN